MVIYLFFDIYFFEKMTEEIRKQWIQRQVNQRQNQINYNIIHTMDYKQLLNHLRSKVSINKYKEWFKELDNSCLFIKEALKKYDKVAKVNCDDKLSVEIKKLNKVIQLNLECIKTLSEFFTTN